MKEVYIGIAFLIVFYMIVWYILAQIKRDNSIVDIAWGLGFVLISFAIEFFYNPAPNLILFSLVTIWGLRLAVYIFLRNTRKGEDWRYKKWRDDWGKRSTLIAFFKVFLLQGVFMYIIAFPVMHLNDFTPKLNGIQYIGLGFWLIGFLWESIADHQLYKFKKQAENKGQIMMSGLWTFSRHPNYFGEIILWWGIFLFTLPYQHWYISIVSPLVITWLLNKVSGVPMLESKYKANKTYQEYKSRTNALIPKIF